jgi:hypothetical protein
MWSVKKVRPVTSRANKSTSELCRKNLRNIRGKHENKKLQKSAILGTENINGYVLT